MKARIIAALFALAGLCALIVARLDKDEREEPGPVPPGREAEVLRVTDGDTIRVRVDGVEERVRYIGVNTPEVHHPRRGEEPFGREATEANRALVEGKTVRLVTDVQERDRYGRILAYVYLPDGTFVNAALVERGFAQVMTVPPNVRHAERFLALEREARREERGLWAER
jgi:micrococcal nuclease